MPETPETFFLTTPIYYVNARPHIGHAYTTIVADVLARRHRLLGHDTYFLTGTDEHGQKIERSALAAGVPPQQFADEVSASFQTLWKRMGITNDDFIRTTEPRHQRGAQKLFAELYERGSISLQSYTGQYCVSEEMFVEGPPGTIGPDGRPTETVTEENFFFRLSDFQRPLLDLIEDGPNGEPPFFKITPQTRRNEILSFLRGDPLDRNRWPELWENLGNGVWRTTDGPVLQHLAMLQATGAYKKSASGHKYLSGALRDLSVSRSSFTWGIPVPEPAASLTKEKHVIYVWLDALANYMTALGYGDPAQQAKFEKYWPADLHLVGKEIIRFHCVYWPAFLLALNPKLAHGPDEPVPELALAEHQEWAKTWLPKSVVAHGWLLFDDSKMSKSKGNIVRTETILDAFGTLCPPISIASRESLNGGSRGLQHPEKALEERGALALGFEPATKQEQDLFAADVLRYFLLREIPFGQDGSFSFEAMITRYNADLTNGYGNLLKRVLTMIEKYFEGKIPDKEPAEEELSGMKENLRQSFATISDCYGSNRFDDLLRTFSGIIKWVDTLLTNDAPWDLPDFLTPDQVRIQRSKSLYPAADALRLLTAVIYPILPLAAASAWHQLGLGDIEQAAKNGDLNNLKWGGLDPGTKLGPLAPIFPRADKGLAQIMADMEQAAQQNQAQRKLEDSPITHTTAQADAVTSRHSEFPEAPISAPLAEDPTHPAAAPRTASLAEPNPGTQVGASAAITTERPAPPSHTEAQTSGIFAHQPPAGPADASPQISIDDFAKVELRVAEIVVAERIPKADKLLRLEVDLGYEKRQILSGIAEWYTPEDLLGRRIVVITNLAPRKMRGLDSHGMLLAASGPDGGKPALATFAGSDELPLGSRLK